MLFLYGDIKAIDTTISGSAAGAASLTDTGALNDFHTGLVTSMQWPGGSQTTASYLDIDINLVPGITFTTGAPTTPSFNLWDFPVSGTSSFQVGDSINVSDGTNGLDGTVTSIVDGVIEVAVSTASGTVSAIAVGSPFTKVGATTSPISIGGVGVVNVVGLPVGTLTELFVDGVSFAQQKLRHGPLGEPGAWYLPQLTGKHIKVRIYNDVEGSASIAANSVFGIGEIFVGRVVYLPTMIKRTPGASLNDPTAFTTQEAGSVFASMRKPARLVSATLGTFSTNDVNSSFYSSIDDGAGGKISIRRLQEIFCAAQGMAVCDIPNSGQGAGTQRGKLRYDQEFIQENFMLARIQNQGGTISMDQPPRYSWSTNWRQSI